MKIMPDTREKTLKKSLTNKKQIENPPLIKIIDDSIQIFPFQKRLSRKVKISSKNTTEQSSPPEENWIKIKTPPILPLPQDA